MVEGRGAAGTPIVVSGNVFRGRRSAQDTIGTKFVVGGNNMEKSPLPGCNVRVYPGLPRPFSVADIISA
jgi:hypothetical protein